jgi:uncharacterized repeat protein (TIGR03803 family)
MVVSGSTLYGATFGDTGIYSGSPTIFSVNIDGSNLHSLQTYAGAPGSGSSALTLAGSELYGTTSSGGTDGRGTLFSMNLDGSNYQTLYSFDSTNEGGSQLTLIGSKLYGVGETGKRVRGAITAMAALVTRQQWASGRCILYYEATAQGGKEVSKDRSAWRRGIRKTKKPQGPE